MDEERGFLGEMLDGVKSVLENTIYSEVAMHKGMQGAAEIVGALYTGSGYVAYGKGQDPVSLEPAQEQGGSYQDMLNSMIAQSPQVEPPEQGLDR